MVDKTETPETTDTETEGGEAAVEKKAAELEKAEE